LRPLLLLALLGRRPWIVDVMVDSSRAGFELRRPGGVRGAANRSCTVDELLPLAPSMNSPISSEWSDDNAVQPPYGCNCAFYRARYARVARLVSSCYGTGGLTHFFPGTARRTTRCIHVNFHGAFPLDFPSLRRERLCKGNTDERVFCGLVACFSR